MSVVSKFCLIQPFQTIGVSTNTSCVIKNNCCLLKSTLLLKIECWVRHIYMKTKCLQTKWDATSERGKGKSLKSMSEVTFIKSWSQGTWADDSDRRVRNIFF